MKDPEKTKALLDEMKAGFAKKRAAEEAAKVDEKPIDLNEQVIANKEPYVARHSGRSAVELSTEFLDRVKAVSFTKLSQASNDYSREFKYSS